MSSLSPMRVLVVDDDADTRANLCDILELDKYAVDTAGNIAELLRHSNWDDYFAILLDRRLPDGTAEQVLPTLRQQAPRVAVLIVTGHADIQGAVEALRQGAADYIVKPINPEALRGSLLRVAERQRLAQAKERSEAAFRTLVEAAPCMIVILRADHSIVYFSPFAEELTGFSAHEVLRENYLERFLLHPFRDPVAMELYRVFQGIPSRGYEKPVLCRDGSQRWMVWNTQRLDDYEGEPAILAVGQDITNLKQAQEQALQSARLAAIGQMVTGLAHESGNALARSQACLEMLTWEVQDKPEAIDLIGRIQSAQNHLQHLYEEVRGYAAPLKLERELWNLQGVWRQAWQHLSLLRQGKTVTLREDTHAVNLECSVDNFRLEQVFRNILENSLAACKEPIEIDIDCSDSDVDGEPALRIAIRDNGPGLNAEQRQRIFDPFFTTKTKGTGLGMAIARRIIEAHGGTIAVGADAGPGAEIIIVLPRGQSS